MSTFFTCVTSKTFYQPMRFKAMPRILRNYIHDKMQRLKITFKAHLDDRYFGSQVNPKPKMILFANWKPDFQVTEILERGL